MVSGEDFQSVFETPIYLNMNLIGTGSGSLVTASLLALATEKAKDTRKNVLKAGEVSQILIEGLMGPIDRKVDKVGSVLAPEKVFVTSPNDPIVVPPVLTKRLLKQTTSKNAFTQLMTYFLQEDLIGMTLGFLEISGTVSMWSLLRSHSNYLLNEVYTELLPVNTGKGTSLLPSLVLRAIPFSSLSPPDESCISFIKGRDGYKLYSDTLKAKASESQDLRYNISKSYGFSNEKTSSFGRPLYASTNDPLDEIRREINIGARSPAEIQEFYIEPSATEKLPDNTAKHFFVSWAIEESQILGLNVGKSDAERFNFFFVVPSAVASGSNVASLEGAMIAEAMKDGGIKSLANTNSFQRHGLRPYIASTNFFVDDQVATMNNIVRDIWEPACLYENGSVTLTGCQRHIPVGTNVVFPARKWMAHVESVQHEFRIDYSGTKEFRTTIHFSRLQTVNGAPIDLTEMPSGSGVNPNSGELGSWDRGITRVEPEHD